MGLFFFFFLLLSWMNAGWGRPSKPSQGNGCIGGIAGAAACECNCSALEQRSTWFCLCLVGILACVRVFASVLSEALCICLLHVLRRSKRRRGGGAGAWFVHALTWWPRVRRGADGGETLFIMPDQAGHSTDIWAESLFGESKHPGASDFFFCRMIYSALRFVSKKWRITGKWEAGSWRRLFFLSFFFIPDFFRRPSGQHICTVSLLHKHVLD